MSTDWITLRARTMTGKPMEQSIRLSSLRIHWHHRGATIVSNDRGIATQIVEEPASLLRLAQAVGMEDIPAIVTGKEPELINGFDGFVCRVPDWAAE